MEIFTSACFILMLYCTEWFGLRHCVAVPVPTLSNYYQQSNSNNNDFGFRQFRNPDIHDKFIFPRREYKMNRRSGGGSESAGKIFFPDEITSSKEKPYKYNNMETEARPVWSVNNRHYPAPSRISTEQENGQDLDLMSSFPPAQDGAYPAPPSRRKSAPKRKKGQTVTTSEIEPPPPPKVTSEEMAALLGMSDKQLSEEQLVSAAAKEFYQWLKRTKGKKADCKHLHRSSLPSSVSTTTDVQKSSSEDQKSSNHVSEHSLTAGFTDGKCPDGQIRVENGDCKAKVEV